MRWRRPREVSLTSSEGAIASGSSGKTSTARGIRHDERSASSTPSRLTVSSGLSGLRAAFAPSCALDVAARLSSASMIMSGYSTA
ncbi:Uncharacterised protein [Collinsella intestinalis]|nr:Uncharacterised protein [Collinsella intestinalis]